MNIGSRRFGQKLKFSLNAAQGAREVLCWLHLSLSEIRLQVAFGSTQVALYVVYFITNVDLYVPENPTCRNDFIGCGSQISTT